MCRIDAGLASIYYPGALKAIRDTEAKLGARLQLMTPLVTSLTWSWLQITYEKNRCLGVQFMDQVRS